MRGSDERSGSLFSYLDLEARVRPDHPLRTIRAIANAALSDLSGDFAALYPPRLGRPSIPPERLLRAMLLQAFYGIRSERLLAERIEFDLLFRWFVGLGVDEPAFDHSSFSKNRDRLLEGEIAAKFLRSVLAQPRVKRLISSDHFSVDGTLIEAWASIKSFRRKDGQDNDPDGPGRNAERGFHKEKRSNETHQSTTDPEARLYKKADGQPAKLCYAGHALMENRHGLVVEGALTQATGTAEREAALAMLDRRRGQRRGTPGGGKAHHVGGVIIIAMVILSVDLNFFMEFQARHAVEAIRKQAATTATVIRDGREQELAVGELVPGDVIRLHAGDLVPGDGRLIESRDLHVRESALTGESLAVEKTAADLPPLTPPPKCTRWILQRFP